MLSAQRVTPGGASDGFCLTLFDGIIDIHSSTLGLGKSDNSLARIPEIKGELAMVRKPSHRVPIDYANGWILGNTDIWKDG